MKDNRQSYIAHRIQLRMLHDLKASALKHMDQSVVHRIFWKEPTGGDAEDATTRNPPEMGGMHVLPTARAILQWRSFVQQYRQDSRPRPKPDYKTLAMRNWHLARNLIANLGADFPAKPEWRPDVGCYPKQPSHINPGDGPGKVQLPIHWHRTVVAHGIAICNWVTGTKKSKWGGTEAAVKFVLVVRAKAQPSAFLADMGISYFEVEGLRIGPKSAAVVGYAFAAEKCRPVFSLTFKHGVEQMKKQVEAATIAAMNL